MDEPTKILKLLETLSALDIGFTIVNGDTVIIKNLDKNTHRLLNAIIASEPDEYGEVDKGFRLWWD